MFFNSSSHTLSMGSQQKKTSSPYNTGLLSLVQNLYCKQDHVTTASPTKYYKKYKEDKYH